MNEQMAIISVYWRESNRHQWRMLTERPIAKRDWLIEWAKEWRSRLPSGLVRSIQLGYVEHDVSRCGGERDYGTLASNDPNVRNVDFAGIVEEGQCRG